jgi:LCP family protein required for cell wall assembly
MGGTRQGGQSASRILPLLVVGALVAIAPALVTDAVWRFAGASRERGVTDALSALPAGRPWPRNVLVVGTDSRERYRHEAGDRFGPADTLQGERADVVMLVRIDREGDPARVLNIPRDLLVEVDGYGRQRLSTALEYGGPPLLVRTVRAVTGLPVHHYLDIDFLGFAELVDLVGGVEVEVEVPVRDAYSGLDLGAGRQRIDGWMALAMVRARNTEERRSGEWRPVEDGDRGRLARQQHVIRALSREARTHGLSPGRDVAAIRRVGGHVRLDSRLLLQDALVLFRALAGAAPAQFDILPTSPALSEQDRTSPFPPHHVGTLNYLQLVEPAARHALEGFAR